MKRTLLRLVATITLAIFAGCTTWTATHSPLQDLDGQRVRITTLNGEKIDALLMHPDTLGNRVLLRRRDASAPLILDTSRILTIEKRSIHEGHTMGLILLGAGAVAFTIIQIQLVFNDPDY